MTHARATATTVHPEPHPQAGQTVALADTARDHQGVVIAGAEYVIEDWWDRVSGGSWMTASGNPAAMIYAIRAGFGGLPADDEVLYGKIRGAGQLVHVSELPS